MGILVSLILSCVFVFGYAAQGLTGLNISPSPATFSSIPSAEGKPGSVHEPPRSVFQENGSDLRLSPATPPLASTQVPRIDSSSPIAQGDEQLLSPNTPIVSPPNETVSPPLIDGADATSPTARAPYNFFPPTFDTGAQIPSLPPDVPQKALPINENNVPPSSSTSGPAAMTTPKIAPAIQPRTPSPFPPNPITPVLSPLNSPPRLSGQTPQAAQPVMPKLTPPVLPAPVASPVDGSRNSSVSPPVMPPKSPVMPKLTPPPVLPDDAAPVASPVDGSRNSSVSPPVMPPKSLVMPKLTPPPVLPDDAAPVASPVDGSRNSSVNSPVMPPKSPVMPKLTPPPVLPDDAAPVASPVDGSRNSSVSPPVMPPKSLVMPKLTPPPVSPAPVASPVDGSRNSSVSPPVMPPKSPVMPKLTPPPVLPAPVASPVDGSGNSSVNPPVMPPKSPVIMPDPLVSPASTPPSSTGSNNYGIPVAAPPPTETPKPSASSKHSPTKGSYSAVAPSPTNEEYHYRASSPPTSSHSYHVPLPAPSSRSPPHGGYHSPQISPRKASPLMSPPTEEYHSPASPPPSTSPHKAGRHAHVAPFSSPPKPRPDEEYRSPTSSSAASQKPRHVHNKTTVLAPASSHDVSPPTSERGPVISSSQTHYAPPPFSPASSFIPSNFSHPASTSHVSPASSTPPVAASGHSELPGFAPKVSPPKSPKVPPPLPLIQALPPPPPNDDCASTTCTDPYTNTPPGAPCDCVMPMKIGLQLNVSVYTFFPLVSKLAEEIASGVFMKQSQVRITGANAATQQPEETVVLTDLVPLGKKFDNTTAFLTYQRLWQKQVPIKASFFGDYEVLYVRYPGLPASPPLPPSSINIINGEPGNEAGNTQKPLGVDVHKRQHKKGISGGVVAIIVISAFSTLLLGCAVAWVLLFKHRDNVSLKVPASQSSFPKPSGTAGSITESVLGSTSLSLDSSIATYAGSAKTFSSSDLEKATRNFNDSTILGEGGFGRVYSGVLEDGTKIAVKVLKRDDQQGGREFLAEVEMLSRLHHRNLVKLIGICTEERARSLVYELISNGSLESHLHGVGEESVPLDWDTRVKIALGAARGLAYLHEDSSPRVIHRDFKASNILLEDDFTPKVSDFGLARAAMDEESRHISTRVMGTFGYVAPEYAMTGHLLVKSDVYSYGVVLLELLTGRKPVDMSRPPGQENLVAWAHPFLTNNEGLEAFVDPRLGHDIPFDSVAKVAAIASMCVQPEVSHRPFMGEVVQALKLVYNECDEAKDAASRSSCQDDFSIDRVSVGSGQLPDPFQSEYAKFYYESGHDPEKGLSETYLFGSSARLVRRESESFRSFSSSGPLRTGRRKQLWRKVRRLYGGSVSEHRFNFKLRPGSP